MSQRCRDAILSERALVDVHLLAVLEKREIAQQLQTLLDYLHPEI